MSDECCKVNFKSAMDTARRMAENPRMASEEVVSERMSICETCEHFYAPAKRCKLCGCYMEMKTKFINMECPDGRWG